MLLRNAEPSRAHPLNGAAVGRGEAQFTPKSQA